MIVEHEQFAICTLLVVLPHGARRARRQLDSPDRANVVMDIVYFRGRSLTETAAYKEMFPWLVLGVIQTTQEESVAVHRITHARAPRHVCTELQP